MFQPHIVLFQPHPSAELNPSKATNADLHGKLWELELGIILSKNGFRFVHTLVCRFYLNFISQWYRAGQYVQLCSIMDRHKAPL